MSASMDVMGGCPKCLSAGPHGIKSNGISQRLICRNCGKSFMAEKSVELPPVGEFSADRVVVTCAVAGSTAHGPFLESLETYCAETGAVLLVIPIKYDNATHREDRPDDWYDPRVVKYLIQNRTALHKNVMLMADVSTRPTAGRPLNGLLTMAGGKSAIFGHPKVALESIPGLSGTPAQVVITTGAVTRPRYSVSRAGAKGEFHHVQGAVIFENDGKTFHMRHLLCAHDGSFYDLDKKWSRTTSESAGPGVLTCGDLHAIRADPDVLEATFFAADSIAKVTKPRYVILHDVLDFQSQSHHNDLFTRVRLAAAHKDDVETEVSLTIKLCDKMAEALPDTTFVIVPSNHNEHLDRWLLSDYGAKDTRNAWFYHHTKAAYLLACMEHRTFNPLQYWFGELSNNPGAYLFLERGVGFSLNGVEYSFHGDKGPNGVRGSAQAFTGTGTRMVIGHSHTARIVDGIVQAGTTSVLDLGYNKGASSWTHSHCLTYPNGKRTLLFIRNRRWRTA